MPARLRVVVFARPTALHVIEHDLSWSDPTMTDSEAGVREPYGPGDWRRASDAVRAVVARYVAAHRGHLVEDAARRPPTLHVNTERGLVLLSGQTWAEACAVARWEWTEGFASSETVRVHATVAACTDAEWEARRRLAAALVLRRAVGDDAGRMVAARLDE